MNYNQEEVKEELKDEISQEPKDETVEEGKEEMEEDNKIESNATEDSITLDEEENDSNDLQAKLLKEEKLAKEYLDKLQRTMAEYDNFRKRTVKEKSQMYENGAKEVFEKIIPVVDNFERALESISEEEKDSTFVKGIEMIHKQLMTTLNDLGVEEMDALFKPFDPNKHHAVSHEENEEYGENEVIAVLQKGYMYKERVLRFSMVKVAN